MKKYVAVAGNIGVGKSTLVTLLCERLGWEPFFEPVAENPYLEDFYEDMPTWAFQSQVFFLTHRLRAQQELVAHPTSVIQDRTVYEDAEIFVENLYRQEQIGERDYATYKDLYNLITQILTPPDLVVYLRASVPVLRQRITQRGRDYESGISTKYLTQLNKLYEVWIAEFMACPVLTVPADELDFVSYPGHLELIEQKVREKLTGKEEVAFAPDEVTRYN